MHRTKHARVSELDVSLREDLHFRRPVTVAFLGGGGPAAEQAARRLAVRLGRGLLRIDLGAVASKYIGETEKNLERVFREAERSGVVLFFDEADALFGKRSDARDAHDRYANLEVNALLQRLEQYEGILALALSSDARLHHMRARRRRVVIPHAAG